MEPTHGDFDMEKVDGIDKLKNRMKEASDITSQPGYGLREDNTTLNLVRRVYV